MEQEVYRCKHNLMKVGHLCTRYAYYFAIQNIESAAPFSQWRLFVRLLFLHFKFLSRARGESTLATIFFAGSADGRKWERKMMPIQPHVTSPNQW